MTPGPIFVVGAPRSGTHLMRYCLSQHSRIYIAPETDYFIRVHGNRRLLGLASMEARAQWAVTAMFASGDPSMAEFAGEREQLRARLAGSSRDWREFAALALSWFAEQKGKPRWGEKTPFHSLYLRQILALFPDACVVAMRREPKNVVASYLKGSHLPDDFYVAVAEVMACAQALAASAGRITHVAYEDLIRRPRAVLEGVCAALGETFEAPMLQPQMRDSSYSGAVMVHDPAIGIEYEEGESEKWRRVLTPDQAALVDALLGESEAHRNGRIGWLARWRILAHVTRLRASTAKNAMGCENLLRAAVGRW